MHKLLVAVGLLLVLSFPAYAQNDAQSACSYTMDSALSNIASAGLADFRVFDEPDAVVAFTEALKQAGEAIPEGVTRILVAKLAQGWFYGVEVGGCLSPPMPIPASLFPASQRLSGHYAFGTFA